MSIRWRLPRVRFGPVDLGAVWGKDLIGLLDLRGGGKVRVSATPSGPRLELDGSGRRFVRLSGSSSPYTGTLVRPVATGTWTDEPDSPTFTPIHEVSGFASLNGEIVEIWPEQDRWLCQYSKFGDSACARIIFTGLCDRTATVTKDGMDYPVVYNGATGNWNTNLLPSGTYTWSVPAYGLGRIQAETGTVTITCPQANVTVNVPVTPAAGYVVTPFTCCQCGVMPEVLTMNVVGASTQYQDCTLQWMTPPGTIPPEYGFGTSPTFFSTTTFFEPFLDPVSGTYPEYYWHFFCINASNTFVIRKVYLPGTPATTGVSLALYSWSPSGSGGCPAGGIGPPPVLYENSCAPLALLSGSPCAGCENVCVQIEE